MTRIQRRGESIRTDSFRARSESLEERVLLAADCAAASQVQITGQFASSSKGSLDPCLPALDLPDQIHTLSSSQNQSLDALRAQYQLSGEGQTVAVIDSGIAFDHEALGGGYGSEYRVVGGWDFAEPRERTPYDDGPAGLHGTHVAGIIGSSDSAVPGVAPSVDFVALRIFDDRGHSRVDWLEAALQWVHDHQDSFENPITTVNLSIGFDAASSEQQLKQIEDELRALYEDDIFVAVAVGNHFSTNNPLALGYPSSSSSVVPVGSVNSSGEISSFSQRNERMLAAPGEAIRSTAPDHVGNRNGVADDFYTVSGTSMAAPYVAGASVLVREAMQKAGRTDIDQDMIAVHLRATADIVIDPATGIEIPVVNIERAIEALLGDAQPTTQPATTEVDQIAVDNPVTETEWGVVDFHQSLLSSGDHAIRVTASRTGTLTFIADDARVDFRVEDGATGQIVSRSRDGRADIQAVQGSTFVVRMELIRPTNLRIANLVVTSNGTMLVSGTSRNDEVRVDGDSLSINDVEYRLAATIGDLQIESSAGRDRLSVVSDGDVRIGISGVEASVRGRTISSQTFEEVKVRQGGQDIAAVATVSGTGGGDVVGVSSERAFLRGGRFQFTAAGFGTYQVDGSGGRRDRIRIEGTDGDDHLLSEGYSVQLKAATFDVVATGFQQAIVESGGGHDTAELIGSERDDIVYATPDDTRFTDFQKRVVLRGFDRVSMHGAGGADSVRLIGSESHDYFQFADEQFAFTGPGFDFSGESFESISVYGRSGVDRSSVYATERADRFDASSRSIYMENAVQYLALQQFEFNTLQTDRRGNDEIFITDSADDDLFSATDEFARMSGSDYEIIARGFARVVATSKYGGNDRATLFDSNGDDSLYSNSSHSLISGSGFHNDAIGFAQAVIRARRGNDLAMVDIGDSYEATGEANRLRVASSGKESMIIGFDRINAQVGDTANVDLHSIDFVFTELDESL
ncbi:MAG: S8 family serine peptidase [Planctomycetales bacterium]|nr:S8 family serine peptidase [Planctomycetales bacterium]